MKKLICLLLLLDLAASAFAATLNVPVVDSLRRPVTNSAVVLAPAASGTDTNNLVLKLNITNTTDATGVTWFSNVISGVYTVMVQRSSFNWDRFPIAVPETNATLYITNVSTGQNLSALTWSSALLSVSNYIATNFLSLLSSGTNAVATNAATRFDLGTNAVTTNLVALLSTGTNTVATNATAALLASTNTVTTNLTAALNAATNGVWTNLVMRATNTVTTNLTAAIVASTNWSGLNTNLQVIVPGSLTNTLYFTNGIPRRVSSP